MPPTKATRTDTLFPYTTLFRSRVPAADPNAFPVSPGVAPDTATLLTWVLDLVPPRAPSPEAPPPVTPIAIQPMTAKSARHRVAPVLAPVPAVAHDALELAYEALDWTPAEAGGMTDAIYEPYALQSLRIRSEEHTSELQSIM